MSEQCTAKSKASGKRCKNKAVPGKTVCRYHGGADGSGGQPGNRNAVKHGVYARIIHKSLSAEDREIYDSVSATDDLDDEIALIRYKIAELTKWIRDNKDKEGFVYPSGAVQDLTDLLRKMVKDKKDREFRDSEGGNRDDGQLDELTRAIRES